MQQLTNTDIGYFSDWENWLSAPYFEAVFIHPKNTPVGRFTNILVSDKSISPWVYNNSPHKSNLLAKQQHCIISDSSLIHPVGAKIFEYEYENFLISYVCIPSDHVGRICGQRWIYGEYDLEQMVVLHTVLINIAHRIRKPCGFSTVILKDEVWAWPAKTENLKKGILLNYQIALHAEWATETILPTDYALIPFSIG